jgi:hypothetical protein
MRSRELWETGHFCGRSGILDVVEKILKDRVGNRENKEAEGV